MKKNKLVLKDRTYKLANGAAPLSTYISPGGNKRQPMLQFDEDKGENREIRYAANQQSIYVDEQDGHVVVEPIVFIDGMLQVPKNNPALQKFLHLHPLNGARFVEINLERDAAVEMENLNYEVDALIECRALSIEQSENVARVMYGIDPSTLTTSELRRDLLIKARNDPQRFLEIVNDPHLKLQSNIQNFFSTSLLTHRRNKSEVWFNTASSKKKMLTIPFGEDSLAACESYFITDDGVEALKMLETYL
tara:strand:+ start:88 stop:834 length:747 start_codon:yes stop_codon:yes gene_type:complete